MTEAVRIQIVRDAASETGNPVIQVEGTNLDLTDPAQARAVGELFSEPIFAAAAMRLTDKVMNSAQKAVITIPLVDGHLDVGSISSAALRQRTRRSATSEPTTI